MTIIFSKLLYCRGSVVLFDELGLRGFDIKPTKYRVGAVTVRGYFTHEVVAALSRYAPATGPEHPEHKRNENEIDELEAIFVPFRVGTEKGVRAVEPEQTGNGHDASGFDWTNGTQHEAGDGAEAVNEAWAKIKAEHAAKKGAQP